MFVHQEYIEVWLLLPGNENGKMIVLYYDLFVYYPLSTVLLLFLVLTATI